MKMYPTDSPTLTCLSHQTNLYAEENMLKEKIDTGSNAIIMILY
jgi:hypothetical protein